MKISNQKIYKILKTLRNRYAILGVNAMCREIIDKKKREVEGKKKGDRIISDTNIEAIGEGRDYYVYKDRSKKRVIKYRKGRKKHDTGMHYYEEKSENKKHIYKIKIHKETYAYKNEELKEIQSTPKYFINKILPQICDAEVELIDLGVILWDFGAKHDNYLIDKDEVIKIIDYGSLACISTGKHIKRLTLRSNIHNPNSKFIRIQFFLHLILKIFGDSQAEIWMSSSQFNKESLNRAEKWVKSRIAKTILNNWYQKSLQISLIEKEGWLSLKEYIDSKGIGNNIIMESADIDVIDVSDECVKIRGYQSYNICNREIELISSDKIWNTEKKGKLICKQISSISKEFKIKSMIDIGCNIGLYVFYSEFACNIIQCIGVDYNKEYILACEKIAKLTGSNKTRFENIKISDIKDQTTELVVCVGLIHHLYHRTEDYGSLAKIVKDLAKITEKVLLVEFPDENDPKAKKWTQISNRKSSDSYTRHNFENQLEHEFSSYKMIGETSS